MVRESEPLSKELLRDYRPFLRDCRARLLSAFGDRLLVKKSFATVMSNDKVEALTEQGLALADYAVRNGLEPPVVLAALYHVLPLDHRQQLHVDITTKVVNAVFEHDHRAVNAADDLRDALRALRLHDGLVSDPTAARNAELVTSPTIDRVRASLLRCIYLTRFMHEEVQQNKEALRQTVEFYFPFLRSGGFYQIHDDLGDAFVREFHPQKFEELKSLLEHSLPSFERAQKATLHTLERLKDSFNRKHHVHISVLERPRKSIYAMFRKTAEGRKLFDIAGLRVIIAEKAGETDERAVANLRHFYAYVRNFYTRKYNGHFPHLEDELDDYIANPKPNGYRALHVPLLVDVEDQILPVEVQFKTKAMHEHAETGAASHGVYKGAGRDNYDALTAKYRLKTVEQPRLTSKEVEELIGRENMLVRARLESSPELHFVVPRNCSPLTLFFLHNLHNQYSLYPLSAKVLTRRGVHEERSLLEPLAPSSRLFFVSKKMSPRITFNRLQKDEAALSERMRTTTDPVEQRNLEQVKRHVQKYLDILVDMDAAKNGSPLELK